ncbi:hypothetical protein MLD38_005417 [Melastoma candidum]|uniref:Uncharacterized protein n=1 Tax=Melastoma candidum TaxID=119954 RepID=A0ACB9RJD3_9MYRT|nr:hypothetical protein MLD38_005417 [Melastoma candidum]
MLLNKQRKGAGARGEKGGNRFLISVTVLGSAGPIRLVVKEEQHVGAVIDTVLKSYAREGRLPVLGSNLDEFLLYCLNHGSDALNPWEIDREEWRAKLPPVQEAEDGHPCI